VSFVLTTPPASPAQAIAHFAARLSTPAALEFARLGYPVKEMIGGYEYWVREGFPVQTPTGLRQQSVDELTAPRLAIGCGC
jgi:hypothetical protein